MQKETKNTLLGLVLAILFMLASRKITDRRALVFALCQVGLVCTSAMKSRLFAGFQCNNCMHACKYQNDIRGENTNGGIYMESIFFVIIVLSFGELGNHCKYTKGMTKTWGASNLLLILDLCTEVAVFQVKYQAFLSLKASNVSQSCQVDTQKLCCLLLT